MKKTYKVDVDCANCAKKQEKIVKLLRMIAKSSFNKE